jgi:hypothetical protein
MNQSGYLQGSGQYPQASGNYGAQPPVYGSGSFGTYITINIEPTHHPFIKSIKAMCQLLIETM